MAIDLNELLALPEVERKIIAEKLWISLSPSHAESTEEKEIIDLLEERWKTIQAGKSAQYSAAEVKQMIETHRNSRSK